MGLMDKVKAAAQDVAAEAKKATTQGKTKLDQFQVRKKADDAAKQLGYLVYRERVRGEPAEPDAGRLVTEIDQYEAEIARLEAETAAARSGAAPAAAPPVASEPAPSAPEPAPPTPSLSPDEPQP